MVQSGSDLTESGYGVMYWFGWLFTYLFGSGWDLKRVGNKNKVIHSKKINKIYINFKFLYFGPGWVMSCRNVFIPEVLLKGDSHTDISDRFQTMHHLSLIRNQLNSPGRHTT